jgi:hypothetical protein
MSDHDRRKSDRKPSKRPSAATTASPFDTFEFGENSELASALDGAHPSVHEGTFSFGADGGSASKRDGSTPILDQVEADAGEAPPAGFDFEDAELKRQIQRDADMKWAAIAVSLEVGLVAAVGASDRALRGLVTGDASALVAATDEMIDAIDELHNLQANLDLDLVELERVGVSTATVRAIGDRALPAVASRILTRDNVGRKWFPLWYQGAAVHRMDGMRDTVAFPANQGPLNHIAAAWISFVEQQSDRWVPILNDAPRVRAWAAGLPAERDVTTIAALWGSNPLSDYDGRARMYLTAVAVDAAPEAWRSYISGDHIKMSDQARAEDATAPDLEIDFARLDAAVDKILGEVDASVYQSDEEVMKALNIARTPAEREYLLTRIGRYEVERGSRFSPVGLKAYSVMVDRLDGKERDQFEKYRSDALDFSGYHGEAVELYSKGDMILDMIQAVPGAVVGQVLGGLAATPILGDILDEAYGGDAKALIAGIHKVCGVDSPEAIALSAEIAYAGGKVTGSLYFGSKSAGGLGSASKLVKGAGAMSTMERVRNGAHATLAVADLAENAVKATGYKVTGTEVSGWEQVAAFAGLAGGVADGATSLYKEGSKLPSGLATTAAQARFDNVGTPASMVGATAKMGHGFTDQSRQAENARSKPVKEIEQDLQDWLDSAWSGHPRRPMVQAALKSRDERALRAAWGAVNHLSAGGSAFEGGLLPGVAGLASMVGK